jgi:hypothetical protein
MTSKRDEEIGAITWKLTFPLCLAAVVVACLPRTSGATNYHVYKKFPAEGQLSKCHVNLKERRQHSHCENQWDFWGRD